MIQPISITHAPLLAAIHAESFGEESWSTDQIKGSLMLASTQGWLLLQGEALAGFIMLQSVAEQWEVLTFAVRPQFRRQGLGEQLLAHVLDQAKAVPASIFLEVATDNLPARKLYEKMGFKLLTTRKNYYVRRDRTIDALCYAFNPRVADASPPIAPAAWT
jgi:ribosomal-protein-alanine N-acetyltransferase